MIDIPEFHLLTTRAPSNEGIEVKVLFADTPREMPRAFMPEALLARLGRALASQQLRFMSFDEHPFKILAITQPTKGRAGVILVDHITAEDGFPSEWQPCGELYSYPVARTIDSGRIGEALVELALLRNGFHVSRLDSTKFAANGDLIAVRGQTIHVVQVKATKEPVVYFGTTAPFLSEGKPFFNRAASPIQATAVVAVADCLGAPQHFVFPVTGAEALAQAEVMTYHEKLSALGKSYAKGQCKIPVASEALDQYRDAWHLLE